MGTRATTRVAPTTAGLRRPSYTLWVLPARPGARSSRSGLGRPDSPYIGWVGCVVDGASRSGGLGDGQSHADRDRGRLPGRPGLVPFALRIPPGARLPLVSCLLYTSDAADDLLCVDL